MDNLLSSKVKVVFVCFACRVSLKRHKYLPLATPDARCPRCHEPMRFVGHYFKVPPRANDRGWRKAEMLWRAGWRADGRTSRGVSVKTRHDAHGVAERAEERSKYLQWARAEASREKWRRARRKKHL